MKVLGLLSLFFVFNAHAFTGQFKIENVRPWGEFGFRATGKGTHISEMRFDCAKTTEMGLVVSVVNNYGKTSNLVIPAEKLGSDKIQCTENLKKYFAGVYNKRALASLKDQQRKVELTTDFGKKKLSFL